MADTTDELAIKGELDVSALLRALISRLTGIEDTQKELRKGQEEANRQQQQTNMHLTQLNGHVSEQQRRLDGHSTDLREAAKERLALRERLTRVEAVSSVQDDYHEKGIREAKLTGWESRAEALDSSRQIRGWVWDIAKIVIAAALVLMVLAAAGVLG